MAKKPTPKKRLNRSRSKSRYKTFENKAQMKLERMVDHVKKIHKIGRLPAVVSKPEKKVTKIKA